MCRSFEKSADSQPHGKATAASDAAVYVNFPAADIYDALYKRKSQAVALLRVRGVALIELIEYVRTRLGRHSAAVIPDRKLRISACFFE